MPRLFRRAAFAALLLAAPLFSSAANRWSINDRGGITWELKSNDAHKDHIEMGGKKVAVIVHYGIDATGQLTVNRQIVWPMLRFQPNKTHDHFSVMFGDDALPRLIVDRGPVRNLRHTRIHHQGIMRIEGTLGRNRANPEVSFTRSIFPSVDKPVVLDTSTYTNRSQNPVVLEFEENTRTLRTNPARGVYGAYVATSRILGAGEHTLQPGESATFTVVIAAQKQDEAPLQIDVVAEEKARADRVASFFAKLQLKTPDPVLNTMFDFAKIRAAESIYETKGGLMHGPGGGTYYAAIWANDQAEYANPYFAMFGDDIANESALVSFRHFARYTNPEYKQIPSSIISEGVDFWNGAGDRGDMAMIAYGATRFALAYGKKETAQELWPLIEWCLEYSRRKTDSRGVIASDSDELEYRFPAGLANLCTSSLHYDALLSAVHLGRDLGKPADQLARYTAEATALRSAIEKHFGATIDGFETYRYFDRTDLINHRRHAAYADKPDLLRAWICMPLTVDIYDRAEGTIDALFSPRLWTEDGLATQADDVTFWDRSTLYALRGVFAAGATEKALDYLAYFSNRRLLGDHVPYAVEAYPEGNQRHLSAESALYCRVITEGMFGLRPTGLRSFNLTPRLPKDWPEMALHKIHAFGGVFDLTVKRDGSNLKIDVTREGQPAKSYVIAEGQTAQVTL